MILMSILEVYYSLLLILFQIRQISCKPRAYIKILSNLPNISRKLETVTGESNGSTILPSILQTRKERPRPRDETESHQRRRPRHQCARAHERANRPATTDWPSATARPRSGVTTPSFPSSSSHMAGAPRANKRRGRLLQRREKGASLRRGGHMEPDNCRVTIFKRRGGRNRCTLFFQLSTF